MKTAHAAALFCLLAAIGNASATTLSGDGNIVELLKQSNDIVVGKVEAVTDGIDERGLPYTEVKIEISETIRGDLSGTYTFRQFGLTSPRLSADGTMKMMPAPTGLPRYAEADEVMLFLSKPATLTGLRSTYGLGAGRFAYGPGRVENDLSNAGLFRNVSIDPALATSNDVRMLETETGAVNPGTFDSFMERAVTGRWVESCMLWNTSEGKTCRTSGSGGTGTGGSITVKPGLN